MVEVAVRPRQRAARPARKLERVAADSRVKRAANRHGIQWNTILWLSLATGLVAVTAKACLLPFPVTNVSEFARWLLRLSIVTSPDWCLVAGLSTCCIFVEAICRRWRAASHAWMGLAIFVYAVMALYHVVTIPMYRVMVLPFSVRMLSFLGGPDLLASSLAPFLPKVMVVGLVAAPLSVCVAPWAAARLSVRLARLPKARDVLLSLLVVTAAHALVCDLYMRRNWTDPYRWERRIAKSAHFVLLRSCVEEALKEEALTNTFDLADAQTADFRPTSERLAQDSGENSSRPEITQPPIPGIPASPAMPRPRNLLWVVMESVSAEYLSVYGFRHRTTPNLERIAQSAVVFENHYAQASSSCKSLIALSAAVYPRPDWLLITRDFPSFDVPTLAEVLSGHGFRTCYAHSGYWSWNNRDRFLSQRGVDRLIDGVTRHQDKAFSWGIRDEVMYDEVLKWIDEAPETPFFAFAYTIETHHPYRAPSDVPDFGAKNPEFERYLRAVHAADAKIARLLDELDRRKLLESTLVVITSDHGESFGRHGQRFHNFCVYDEAVRVPLLMLHPSLVGLPRRNDILGQHIDLAPTCLDLLGIPPPDQWQGQSLFAAKRLPRAYFFSVSNQVVLGVRQGDLKYHYYIDEQREELFDVVRDPLESKNLAAERPEDCEELRRRVAGLVSYQRDYLSRHGAGNSR